ncbi:MAG TPA: serine/threonine protein kinase [Polyangiaceae bacterium]|nr:serine/threonine protein kinase [Polyangiaceae bacterium]
MPAVSEAASELSPGSVIGGKYQVVSTLGVGGSGTVYRVTAVGKSRRLALKLMHAGHPDTTAERARFAREAEVVKRLQHPHIVGLVDYGHDDDGTPYLVQPLLEGETLESKLAREGALPWTLVGRLAIHVLKALDKAHGMGVAHRDIKPANIFVTSGVLGDVAQVLDFGLAKVVRGDSQTQLAVTKVGAVIGTPRYMAPEQARGEQVRQAADIYSFGLVLAEMITGTPLVQGKSDIDLYVAQGSDTPHRLPPEVLRSPFASAVQRSVAKPLDVRYRAAGQMLADLRSITDRLGGGAIAPVEADMDATRMLDPTAAQPLSLPNETSEKLRTAFNTIAKKRAAATARQVSAAPPHPASTESPAASAAGTEIADPATDEIHVPPSGPILGDPPSTVRDPHLHEPALSSFPPSPHSGEARNLGAPPQAAQPPAPSTPEPGPASPEVASGPAPETEAIPLMVLDPKREDIGGGHASAGGNSRGLKWALAVVTLLLLAALAALAYLLVLRPRGA